MDKTNNPQRYEKKEEREFQPFATKRAYDR